MNVDDAQRLAENILSQSSLTEKGWIFGFDRAKKRFGLCDYSRKKISLSRYLVELNTKEIVRDTIVHEVAHALCGHRSGHGKIWKQCVTDLGGVPERCYSTQTVKTPKLKYTITCPVCQMETQKNIPLPKWSLWKSPPACGACCKKHNQGKFSRKFILQCRKN